MFEENTKELHIAMEAFSKEPGIWFQEHYIYEYGRCLRNECEDWTEIWWDEVEYPKFEDFKRDIGENWGYLTEDDFDEDGCYYSGGFGSWEFTV